MREVFVKDYNQNHFIRKENFKAAAAAVPGGRGGWGNQKDSERSRHNKRRLRYLR